MNWFICHLLVLVSQSVSIPWYRQVVYTHIKSQNKNYFPWPRYRFQFLRLFLFFGRDHLELPTEVRLYVFFFNLVSFAFAIVYIYFGASERNRTPNLLITSQLLYH